MRHLFQKAANLYLKERSREIFLSYNIEITGIGESMAADRIAHLLDMANPTVATYSQKGMVRIRITAAAATKEEAMARIEPIAEEIGGIFAEKITKRSHT